MLTAGVIYFTFFLSFITTEIIYVKENYHGQRDLSMRSPKDLLSHTLEELRVRMVNGVDKIRQTRGIFELIQPSSQ